VLFRFFVSFIRLFCLFFVNFCYVFLSIVKNFFALIKVFLFKKKRSENDIGCLTSKNKFNLNRDILNAAKLRSNDLSNLRANVLHI